MKPDILYPDTFCLDCLRKHFCRAMSLAKEFSYEEENEAFIIGDLECAILHCMDTLPELAKEIRDIRHKVQDGDLKSIDWQTTYKKIKEEIKKENDLTSAPK